MTTVIKAPEFKQMGLSECAEYDMKNNLRNKITGWGRICKERNEKGISRKQRRLKRQA